MAELDHFTYFKNCDRILLTAEARSSLFRYVEEFYNLPRTHSVGYLSPIQFGALFLKTVA